MDTLYGGPCPNNNEVVEDAGGTRRRTWTFRTCRGHGREDVFSAHGAHLKEVPDGGHGPSGRMKEVGREDVPSAPSAHLWKDVRTLGRLA